MNDNLKKMHIAKRKCTKILFSILLLAHSVNSALAEPSQLKQCYDFSATHERLEQFKIGDKATYRPDFSLYVNSIEPGDTIIDVRVDRMDRARIDSRIDGALNIALSQIKTKQYLKQEKLVLLDDGLGGQEIEKTVKQLKNQGFQSVKILKRGILSLLKNKRFLGSANSVFALRQAPIDRLISAALNNREQFIFVNLGQDVTAFNSLGISSVQVPYSEYAVFYATLQQSLQQFLKRNQEINIVFTHEDPTIYARLFHAKMVKKWRNIWFIQDGTTSLIRLNEMLTATGEARNRVRLLCQS